MEGELFGHAKGAFSGAVHGHEGLVSAASGGTVFLDEIDDTPHALQAKLLRVLEDRVVTRLGDTTQRTVDFRLVAATNRDLHPLIESGAFGADLYERLAIVSIELPALRERRGDIPGLVRHFIERFYREEPAAAERGRVTEISPEVLAVLSEYRWPGNVRSGAASSTFGPRRWPWNSWRWNTPSLLREETRRGQRACLARSGAEARVTPGERCGR